MATGNNNRNQKQGQAQTVVDVPVPLEGMTEASKASRGLSHGGVASVGPPASLMDAAEYADRQHQNGAEYPVARAFAARVRAIGAAEALLERQAWDELFEQFRNMPSDSPEWPVPTPDQINALAVEQPIIATSGDEEQETGEERTDESISQE